MLHRNCKPGSDLCQFYRPAKSHNQSNLENFKGIDKLPCGCTLPKAEWATSANKASQKIFTLA